MQNYIFFLIIRQFYADSLQRDKTLKIRPNLDITNVEKKAEKYGRFLSNNSQDFCNFVPMKTHKCQPPTLSNAELEVRLCV